LPDEAGLTSTSPSQSETTSGPRAVGGASPPLGRWGRAERVNLIIWAVMGFLIPSGLVFLLYPNLGRGPALLTIGLELPVKAIMAFFVIVATWVVSRREKRPLDDYGLPLRQAFGSRFWEGAFWGFAMLSLVLICLRGFGSFRIHSVTLTGSAIFRYALGWAAVFLAVSFGEELAFRGYWLFLIARRMRFWPAAVILSCLFGVAHVPNHGENGLGIAQVVAIALLFCLTIRRTGTLWFALGFHAAWDWAETFFYGTPDSGLLGVGRFLATSVKGPDWITGGSAGPEGSIFGLFVILVCAGLIHVRFPKVVYPDRPI
jgi:uncharacterized protein